MRKKIVAANWKMNGNLTSLAMLTHQLKESLTDDLMQNCIVFPPFVYIDSIKKLLSDSKLAIGAQNGYPAEAGAFTGEVSMPMLADVGCRYVLVGHSERRQIFHESEIFIAEKFHKAKEHDMIPVLCVGETLQERENGQAKDVIRRQVASVHEANKNCFQNCIIAYEPVWAIGTGKTASPEQAQEMHLFIRNLVAELQPEAAAQLTILYGGSVNEKNARALSSMPDIDGGLVGGASLIAEKFVEIVKCIK